MINSTLRITLAMCVAASLSVTGCKDSKPEASGSTRDTSATTSVKAPSAGPSAFSSEEGRYGISIPEGFSEPREQNQDLATAVGMLKMTMNISVSTDTASKDESAFMTAFVDYPESAFKGDVKEMLDNAQKGALANMKGTADDQQDIELDGNPGRSITFAGTVAPPPGTGDTAQSIPVYGRINYFIVKPRLYQILFLSKSKDSINTDRIKNAFASFTIKAKS